MKESKGRTAGYRSLAANQAFICMWPLSDVEMAAWRKHPDTFFGEVGQRSTKAEDPLDL